MEFGVSMIFTDESVGPRELLPAIEDHGFSAVFVPEHIHIPANIQSSYPHGEFPRTHARMFDPFVVLSLAAGLTSDLKLGFGVCLLAQRDPITTAKAVASLDRLSGGRVLFGVAPGWNREEVANHGVDPDQRFAVLRERVEAVRRLWTTDEATYHGEHVRFNELWSWPKPVQHPHPPVLIGGNGPTVVDRVIAYGDGWMPVCSGDPDDLRVRIEQLHQHGQQVGRDYDVSIVRTTPKPEILEAYREMGVTRCTFRVPSAARDAALPELARLAALRDEFLGS